MHYQATPIWRNSMRLAEEACRLATRLPRQEQFTMRPQIVRSAISVLSNVAEGWSRESLREKAQFLSIAQGSLAELNSQLILCTKLGWLREEDALDAFALERDTGKMLTALRRHFRSRSNPERRAPIIS
jgi:four helix bundle protein